MSQTTTVAAIATPPGQGGIAVIRLSGPQAYHVATKIFIPKNVEKTLENTRGYSALFGHFVSGGHAIDEGIALCFRAPHSYTGEDVIELSCHGGDVVSQAVLSACLAAGAAPAGPGEFTRRAVLNGRLPLTQAEAVMDLIAASSRQGAAMAKAALSGALHQRLCEMKNELITLAGHLAAWTDFPEEDVDNLSEAQFLQVVASVKAQLARWIEQYESNRLLQRGIQAVVVGRPNVGKSTLFNLLSGYDRAIVTPVAGTTRDVLREQIQIGGIPLHLADTAGLHETEDLVESEGIRRSWQEIEKAGLVLAVFDASEPLDDEQMQLAQHCRQSAAIAVVNKEDLGLTWQPELLAPYFHEVLVVSATDKNTLERLENSILKVLKIQEIDTDAPALANQRQLAAAALARDALAEAENALALGLGFDAAGVCVDDALRALSALMGEDASEAVLEEVFSKFCVGK